MYHFVPHNLFGMKNLIVQDSHRAELSMIFALTRVNLANSKIYQRLLLDLGELLEGLE